METPRPISPPEPSGAPEHPRDWVHPDTLERAAEAQREIAGRVLTRDDGPPPRFVAGVDCSGAPRGAKDAVRAMAVLLDRQEHRPGEPARPAATGLAGGVPRFPYVPGFLGFREIPFVLEAVRRLPRRPELLMVDGHGLSHPRGCGIASHLGVVLDLPAIGVAKSILVGRPAGELGEEPGATVPLVWRGRVIATVLRTRRWVKPVYVSVGHRISQDQATWHVLDWLSGRRLPEPTRLADRLAGEARQAAVAGTSDTLL